MAKIGALILAAGAGSRFMAGAGIVGYKPLAQIQGRRMLQAVIDLANLVVPGNVHTVLGNGAQEIARHISNTELLINPDWQQGLGRSIGWSVGELMVGPQNYDGLLLILGDQPLLTVDGLRDLLGLYDRTRPVCALYNNSLGAPALFPREQFLQLAQLQDDTGAKQLLLSMGRLVRQVPMPEAAVDIDTVEDLHALTAKQDR